VKLGKIFKVFKKGAKVASSRSGGQATGGIEWPAGLRIGIYGHANAGKTVYFTVLNEECKIARNLQLSVNDNITAGEFLTNYRALWGIGATSTVGTMVDLKEEKRFPDPTRKEKILQFSAIIDGSEKIPVVTCDYDGKAVDISEPHDFKDRLIDFMTGADGLMFFFDPKILGAVVHCQAHAASFVHVLEQLAPLNKRLPIPVTLVITKADILPGFSSDSQTVLVSPEDESFLAEDYELFLTKVLTSNNIASNAVWAGTVRDILVKLKEFLKVVVGRTLDFQIFFVSCTGQTPEKVGTEVGRSIYAPPEKMQPIGVKRPFYWVLNAISRSRRVSVMRKLAKWVILASVIWMTVVSLPYLFHFAWLLPRTLELEDNTLGQRHRMDATSEERRNIVSAYRRYENAWVTKWVFKDFRIPAARIRASYDSKTRTVALADLDRRINQLADLVADPSLWPTINPVDQMPILTDIHLGLEAGLKAHHQGDSTSELFTRSSRALAIWELLKGSFMKRTDSAAWAPVLQQVSVDRQLYATSLSSAEKKLHQSVEGAASGSMKRQQTRVQASAAGSELETMARRIADAADDPEYLLGKAVRDLKRVRSSLLADPSRSEDVARIDRYLSQAKYFDKRRDYDFSVDYCPSGTHVHIAVVKPGADENWPSGMIVPGRPQKLTWKAGDVIYIALDKNDHDGQGESFGRNSKVRKQLDGPFALFDMMGEIVFPSGDKVTINFKVDPREKLPNLEE